VRSSAGTQGVLAAARHADEVILGSYMTAAAIVRYIHSHAAAGQGTQEIGNRPDTVTIVAMGFEGVTRSVEDERCGDYIEHLFTGRPYDHLQAIWECLHDPDIASSLRGEHHYRPKEDIVLALQRDLFDFAMVGGLEGGYVRVTRQESHFRTSTAQV
jgi:2-phosphosulfolactate phosphatase